MPVYVYRNLVTNETFEQHQRITDDPLTVDPRTGEPVKRVIQPVGIAFRGSGFYVNDSRGGSSSSNGSADSNGSAEKKSGESSAVKSEAASPAAGATSTSTTTSPSGD